MPIYEYQCKACGHVFEREHAIGEKKKYKCPECSHGGTRKLVSQVGVVFKGTGFYATDSRKGNGGDNGGTCPARKDSDAACESCPVSEN